MKWTNEWIEQGKAEGLMVGELKLLGRQLRSRLGPGADPLQETVSKLCSEQLDEFADALFDFTSLSDAQHWLAQRV